MQELKSGDRVAPVTATHVVGVPQINGVVFRMDYVTRTDQPIKEAVETPNFIMKPAQARALAKNLLEAADKVEQGAAQLQAAQPKH
ncbi:hypothetical protein [Pseudorhodoferax sp.]|uniref:hypothetical protein n=1 Tax=Pseudorhodoferax sp. TaxID=1993553 RepID=UPI002DD687C9|nr:hypothetical protein [Pseudorhodoferax sp.]